MFTKFALIIVASTVMHDRELPWHAHRLAA